MPLAKTTAAATKQATAPTAEHPLKRVADTHDGSNAGLSEKLPKHAGSSQTPDAPKGASFSNDAREHVRFAQLQQKFDKLSTMDTAFDAEDLDDDALLEAARELAEHSSSLEYCCSGLETLSVQANVYADEQTLVGVFKRRVVGNTALIRAAQPPGAAAHCHVPRWVRPLGDGALAGDGLRGQRLGGCGSL